jgi:hypothetical protein
MQLKTVEHDIERRVKPRALPAPRQDAAWLAI